jgi:choline dehydrogenase-like flavoprotein
MGRFKFNNWLLTEGPFPDSIETGGHHHLGGTRMGTNISDGVVDINLKVFNKENLYILGSSVFPTGGHANPTLTILQLAMRLSSHLLQR